MTKKNIMPVAVLTVICIVVAILLAVVNYFAAPEIAKNAERKVNESLYAVLEDAEGFTATTHYPADAMEKIDSAATLMHMMNANTFTSACYKLKEGTNVKDFSETLRKNIMARQWICGTPETYLAMNVNDEYIVSAFGADDLIKTFKTNEQKAIGTVSVISEEPIAE